MMMQIGISVPKRNNHEPSRALAVGTQRKARPQPRHVTARANTASVERPEAVGNGSALQKSFSLLESLIYADHPLALAELSSQLKLPKATVHRLLFNLEAAQLLRRDETGKRYVLGERLTRFSLRALVFSARMAPVQAILERLVAEIGESVNLGVLDGTAVAYVQRVECNWPLRTHLTAGSRVPLHCTATGKLFLALMPKARRTALLDQIDLRAYAPNTITTRKKLEEELSRIQQERISLNDEEYMVGAVGLSVPLVDFDGEIIAGLAVHAPVARLTVEAARNYVPILRRTTEKLAKIIL
jgi:IclR family acetate operon transcriptional repressor